MVSTLNNLLNSNKEAIETSLVSFAGNKFIKSILKSPPQSGQMILCQQLTGLLGVNVVKALGVCSASSPLVASINFVAASIMDQVAIAPLAAILASKISTESDSPTVQSVKQWGIALILTDGVYRIALNSLLEATYTLTTEELIKINLAIAGGASILWGANRALAN